MATSDHNNKSVLLDLDTDEDVKYLRRHSIHFLFDRVVENLIVARPLNVLEAVQTLLEKERDTTRKIVLIRHAETIWDKDNQVSGWSDPDLSHKGLDEAHQSGQLLRQYGYSFDFAFTSFLKRSIRTLWISLDTLEQQHIPIHKRWQLNARHYGMLEGKGRTEISSQFGDEQTRLWFSTDNVPAPEVARTDSRYAGHDRKYKAVPSAFFAEIGSN